MYIYDLWLTGKAQELLCPHSMLKQYDLTEKQVLTKVDARVYD